MSRHGIDASEHDHSNSRPSSEGPTEPKSLDIEPLNAVELEDLAKEKDATTIRIVLLDEGDKELCKINISKEQSILNLKRAILHHMAL